MSRDYRHFLVDIRDGCDRIRRFVAGMDLDAFKQDDKTKAAVERELFVLGEAVKNLPSEIRSRFPEVEWRDVAGFRDVLAHGYSGIDLGMMVETHAEDPCPRCCLIPPSGCPNAIGRATSTWSPRWRWPTGAPPVPSCA